MEGSVVTLESESTQCLVRLRGSSHARAGSRQLGGTVSQLTAHLPVSERPLHSDPQVAVRQRGRSQPTLSAAGSLQYELTFYCGVWWWLREAWKLPKTTELGTLELSNLTLLVPHFVVSKGSSSFYQEPS